MCDSPVTDDADRRAYKLNALGRVERKFGLHGECGLALADHDKFTFDAPWGVDDMTPHEVQEHFRKEMREMRDNTLQYFDDDNSDDVEGYINWAAWRPPKLKTCLVPKDGAFLSSSRLGWTRG